MVSYSLCVWTYIVLMRYFLILKYIFSIYFISMFSHHVQRTDVILSQSKWTLMMSYPQSPLMGSCTLLSVSRSMKSLSVTLQSDSVRMRFTLITPRSATAWDSTDSLLTEITDHHIQCYTSCGGRSKRQTHWVWLQTSERHLFNINKTKVTKRGIMWQRGRGVQNKWGIWCPLCTGKSRRNDSVQIEGVQVRGMVRLPHALIFVWSWHEGWWFSYSGSSSQAHLILRCEKNKTGNEWCL